MRVNSDPFKTVRCAQSHGTLIPEGSMDDQCYFCAIQPGLRLILVERNDFKMRHD